MKDILLTVGLIGLLVVFFLYLFQRTLIYFPAKQTPELAAYKATDMEVVHLRTADGLKLRSWYKQADPHKPTILFLHGNAGHIGFRMPMLRQYLNKGYGLFLLEYRGYGGNKGRPTEQGLYQDARAAIKYLQSDQGLSSHDIVLYGESLGTAVATKIASEYPVCAVILQSPFTSLAEVGRRHYPWMLIDPWDKFDSYGRIEKINAPLLIMHGLDDDVVPYEYGMALFNKAKQPKKMLHVDGGNHQNVSRGKGVFDQTIAFIDQSCSR